MKSLNKQAEAMLTSFLTGKNKTKASGLGIWLVLATLVVNQKETDLTYPQQLRRLCSPYTSKQLKAIWDTVLSFVQVDDRYDSMKPSDILAHGGRPELREDQLSDFAKNFLRPQDLAAFYNLEKLGPFTKEQITLHVNIATQLMWDEANYAQQFLETGSAHAREELKNLHIKMAKFNFFTFSQILNPRRTQTTGAGKIRNYEDMEKAYPTSSEIGLITQIYDDVHDVLRDLHEEIHFGRPSGNVVLEAVNKKVGLSDTPGKLKKIFVDTYNKQLQRTRPVPLMALPKELREGIMEARGEYMSALERMDIPEIAKTIFRASFESMLKEGINPPIKISRNRPDQRDPWARDR